MTRIDGKGGSRIVPCPECGAAKGEHCMDYVGPRRDDFTTRKQSHARRTGKAYELLQKRDRAKRLTNEETIGLREMRAAFGRFYGGSESDLCEARIRGRNLAVNAALDAIDKLIRTRGAR